MTYAIESQKISDADLITIDMIVACHHVYNCQQRLKYSGTESQKAFVARISDANKNYNEESCQYSYALGKELENSQLNESNDGSITNNDDATVCTITSTNIPTISYFMKLIYELVMYDKTSFYIGW